MTNLRATYRLQLNKDFPLQRAQALVPYLKRLGVSHVYLSPVLKAQPGSTHGYDTVDHALINPELGTIEDFRALAGDLRAARMGIILDFVPNHMGVGGASNGLWLDVLKHGQASQYADWFDIDWQPSGADLAGKLMVPFLGTSYAEALASGQIVLKADADGLAVWAYDAEKLPLRPEDEAELIAHYGASDAAVAALNGIKDEATSWKALDALISKQHWRLVHHAAAADDINYRRFFINSELAGISIDKPAVFDHAHQMIFGLIDEGLVDGLRIDHVDGLLDPKGYLETLRAKVPRPILLFIEKILAPHEQLRADWPVDGTTGYEFGAELTRVLTNPAGEASVTETYRKFVGKVREPHEEAYVSKLRVMDNELAAELATLGRHLAGLAHTSLSTSDLTQNGLRKAAREVIAHLEVYRTYADDAGIEARDQRELRLALGRARQAAPHYQPALFDFLEKLLLGTLGAQYDPRLIAVAVGRFQQFTGPVMAKGLEDTALYRYNRLVSLNEVGAHPDRFSLGIEAFHAANARRLVTHPLCMLATSTHDTKRGEDTRALIGAIADHPDAWATAVSEWKRLLTPEAHGIHPNDFYLLMQLVLGGWPIVGETDTLAERLTGAMTKSVREARERSDWGVNNTEYETALGDFITAALSNADFIDSIKNLGRTLTETGKRKALVQAAIKLTVPGVPDIYRGAEDWEQSFVDPDNRRPVDFAGLAKRLAAPEPGYDDKIVLTQRLLALREQHPDVFASGSYELVDAGSETLAFVRAQGGTNVLVMADLSAGHRSALSIPQALAGENWRNVLDNGGAMSWPVMVLVRQ